jgi:hypothetical protein
MKLASMAVLAVFILAGCTQPATQETPGPSTSPVPSDRPPASSTKEPPEPAPNVSQPLPRLRLAGPNAYVQVNASGMQTFILQAPAPFQIKSVSHFPTTALQFILMVPEGTDVFADPTCTWVPPSWRHYTNQGGNVTLLNLPDNPAGNYTIIVNSEPQNPIGLVIGSPTSVNDGFFPDSAAAPYTLTRHIPTYSSDPDPAYDVAFTTTVGAARGALAFTDFYVRADAIICQFTMDSQLRTTSTCATHSHDVLAPELQGTRPVTTYRSGLHAHIPPTAELTYSGSAAATAVVGNLQAAILWLLEPATET